MLDTTADNQEQAVRGIAHRFPAESRREGAGTHITRWFVPSDYALTDPFLLFDETRSDKIEEYAGGFPEHPHRGFEALTYMLAGTLRHNDSAGYSGYVGPCGAQWLTNAAGLTHDEVPEQTDGLFWCMQLWINLPAANKGEAPFYDEAAAEQMPLLTTASGNSVRLVAGEYESSKGPLPPRPRPSQPVYLDVTLNAANSFSYTPPAGFTVLLFVVEGQISIKADKVGSGETLLLEQQGRVQVETDTGARLLVMAGQPLGEDIAWHGPFVLSNEQDLQQAFEDFSRFGPFKSDAGTGMENE